MTISVRDIGLYSSDSSGGIIIFLPTDYGPKSKLHCLYHGNPKGHHNILFYGYHPFLECTFSTE